MDKETLRLVKLATAWCGPLFVIGYIIFWAILGHNVPPPNFVGMTPEQLVSEYYGKYQSDIEIGMIGCCFVGLLYLPWSCLLATMLRDENGNLSLFSFLELTGGGLTAWLLAFCPAMWAACAFYVNIVDPAIIKMMHSLVWYIYDITFMITTTQTTGLGLYIILNKKQQVFPAWTGWCTIAAGMTFLPLVLIPFVSEGPFAVGGSWNFFIVFGTWLFAFFAPISFFMFKELMGQKESVKLSHAH